jgi:hypothetical protein
MGKKRVQVRQVRKQVKPKPASAAGKPAAGQAQRRQRERYVEEGGLLRGRDPEWVLRLGYISAGVAVACILIAVELIFGPIAPHGLPVRIVAAIIWLIPVVLLVSFVAPGIRLAYRDRSAQSAVVQGQLLGASSVSQSLGLGMIMLKTRGGNETYLVPPEKLTKVPGNVVQVMLSITPNLRYVRSLSVIGQRQVARPEPPMPPSLHRLLQLQVVTPVALAAGAVLGDDIVAFIPMNPDALHAVAALVGAIVLGGGAFGASFLYQRRLTAEVQALVPPG